MREKNLLFLTKKYKLEFLLNYTEQKSLREIKSGKKGGK
jgi:hypothetical protein